MDEPVLAFNAQPGDPLGDKLRAEASSLDVGAAAQIRSRYSRREAEVVFDSRSGTRLSAGRLGFDDQCAKAFACAVDRGGEACRACANHDDVVELLGCLGAKTDARRKLYELLVKA